MLHLTTFDNQEVYFPQSSIVMATVMDEAIRIKLVDGKCIFVSHKKFKEELQRIQKMG